ncbi:hypothetical protein FB451DRAFT_1380197, partial [Mycena latifolia]
MAVLRCSCDLGLIATIWTSNEGLEVLNTESRWITILAVALAPAGDCVIALSMCYYLWRLRESGSQFRRTRTMVDTLMIWTV